MDPYLILSIPPGSDDAAIRRAYLDAIKTWPPDHDPQKFQAISLAYQQIKDELSRDRYMLFDQTSPGDSPFETLVRQLRWQETPPPLPMESMKAFLRACTKT